MGDNTAHGIYLVVDPRADCIVTGVRVNIWPGSIDVSNQPIDRLT